MTTYIKTLKNPLGDTILPRTRTDAIITPDGDSLNNVLVVGDDQISFPIVLTPASNIGYDNSISGLVGDTVQEVVDEISENLNSLSASNIDYNNTISGLTAMNSQTAIDELALKNALKFYGKYSQMSGGDAKSGSAQSGYIIFTTEDFDDFSAINIATNNTKIIIPIGVTKVKFYCRADLSSDGGQGATIQLKKGGNLISTLFSIGIAMNGGGVSGLMYSTPISCVAGDEFQLYASLGTNVDTKGTLGAGSIFGMEVLG